MTPAELAERRYVLSVEMGTLSEQLEKLEEQRRRLWPLLLEKHGKVNAAEREWESTEEGIKQMHLDMQMKQKAREIAGISSLLRVKELEARNLW